MWMLIVTWFNKLKHFFGFFNLTDFEVDLMEVLRKEIPTDWKEALDSQLKRFNKVDRVLEPASELPFGHTSFYWTRFGKAKFDFPKKFPSKAESELLATVEVFSPQDDNLIRVSFGLVHGFLFTIKYRSKKKIFIPRSRYVIRNFNLELKQTL